MNQLVAADVFNGFDSQGRRQYSRNGIHGTKKQAETALAAYVIDVGRRKADAVAEGRTLISVLDDWLEHRSGQLSPATVDRYRVAINRTRPVIGKMGVARLEAIALVEIHSPARKHGCTDDDIHHAVDLQLVINDLGDDDEVVDDELPYRLLVIGPDRAGNVLEIIVLIFDDERRMAIHAMPIRPKYPPSSHRKDQPMTEKKTYGTSRGHVVDDDVIEVLAAEAEVGYEVTKFRRRGGRQLMGSAPAEVVPVRLDPELRAEIERRAEAEHTTTSEIIRAAIRRFLDVA